MRLSPRPGPARRAPRRGAGGVVSGREPSDGRRAPARAAKGERVRRGRGQRGAAREGKVDVSRARGPKDKRNLMWVPRNRRVSPKVRHRRSSPAAAGGVAGAGARRRGTERRGEAEARAIAAAPRRRQTATGGSTGERGGELALARVASRRRATPRPPRARAPRGGIRVGDENVFARPREEPDSAEKTTRRGARPPSRKRGPRRTASGSTGLGCRGARSPRVGVAIRAQPNSHRIRGS